MFQISCHAKDFMRIKEVVDSYAEYLNHFEIRKTAGGENDLK
jgi:hypothetical protein